MGAQDRALGLRGGSRESGGAPQCERLGFFSSAVIFIKETEKRENEGNIEKSLEVSPPPPHAHSRRNGHHGFADGNEQKMCSSMSQDGRGTSPGARSTAGTRGLNSGHRGDVSPL